MTGFLDKLAVRIFESAGYAQASNSLFEAYVLNLIGENRTPDRQELKKLMFSAQAFLGSSDSKLRNEGAILLSMGLDVAASAYPDILPIADTLFANSGNFPNLALLLDRYPNAQYQRSILAATQLEFRRELNSVDQLGFPLTDYQRVLWKDLIDDHDVITSAPTSAGKTHIILHYLLDKVANSGGAFAAVVVPTRALISEVAGKLYELAKEMGCADEIEVCTVPKDGNFKSKTFFVMTQERLHDVLLRGDITFNFFFLDEAHNIADQSRGVLLHITVERLLEDSVPQIIVSMPSDRYQNSFSTVFEGTEFKRQITANSPVSKIVMTVVPKRQDLIVSRLGTDDQTVIRKGFKKKKLANIVFRLGQNDSNIIYRNRTDYCENFANDIASLIEEDLDDERLLEAADYIEKFIHAEFSLAQNLRKGVAFHYGPLPSSIRILIEGLVKDGLLKFVACTSTLAEGVNLPAKNLFLQNPTQPAGIREPDARLDDVKINNITGRAGRMLHHFAGNIFLIEPGDWKFQDYFEEKSDGDEKIPSYFNTLNEELDGVLRALHGQFDPEDNDQYRFYTVANKLIKEYSDERLSKTLNAVELRLSASDTSRLVEAIEDANSNLRVAPFTLEANPTVGYIQQNNLYTRLSLIEDYSDWLLPHPRSSALYATLVRVGELLRDCGIYVPAQNYSLEYVCVIARKWIQEKSLREMISEQINWDSRSELSQPSINASVRNVIKVINNDVRFRLSNALRCYYDLISTILISKGIENHCVKLHAFMEIGASDDRMISLISLGVSREAALQMHEIVPQGVSIESFSDVARLMNSGALDQLHPVTKKEVMQLLDI